MGELHLPLVTYILVYFYLGSSWMASPTPRLYMYVTRLLQIHFNMFKSLNIANLKENGINVRVYPICQKEAFNKMSLQHTPNSVTSVKKYMRLHF